MPELSRRIFLAGCGSALTAQWATRGIPCSAAPAWQDSRSHGPFQLQATFPLGELTPLFQDLSALELELQRTLAVLPAQHGIDVFLLNDQTAHKEILAQLYPRVPYRRPCTCSEVGSRASTPTAILICRLICDMNAPMPCSTRVCRWCPCGSMRVWLSISRCRRENGPTVIPIWQSYAGTSGSG